MTGPADLGSVLALDLEPERLATVTLEVALVLIAAVLAVRLTTRFGVPALLIFLGIGMALSAVAGENLTVDADLAVDLGFFALALILAEGGLTTRWVRIRPVVPVAGILATVGVFVSTGVVAALTATLLDFDLRSALVLGVVVSSTDAAAVFATLRGLRIRSRPVATLEAESGFNDAPVAIMVAFLASADPGDRGLGMMAFAVAYELVVGAAVGYATGRLGAWVLRRIRLPIAGLYPVAAISFAVLGFGAALLLHSSGFLAVYIAGVVLGNSSLPHRRATLGFAEATAWLAQIGLFVLLGLLVDLRRLPGVLVPALVTGTVLLLLARPLSVLLSTVWFRFPAREMAFLSWAGLRGAVPIVFALVPVAEGFRTGEEIFYIVFFLVVVLTLVQGLTLPGAARRLDVVSPAAPLDLEVDVGPLEALDADLLALRITPGSRLHGVYIAELRLPGAATVSLVVRGGRPMPATGSVRLVVGDQILVVAPGGTREAVEARLAAVSAGGHLAKWLGTPPGPP